MIMIHDMGFLTWISFIYSAAWFLALVSRMLIRFLSHVSRNLIWHLAWGRKILARAFGPRTGFD